ncbi:MAG: choice-of-anchor tandem repeat GloVer-containing protein [Rhodanobacteraceae bacterium]
MRTLNRRPASRAAPVREAKMSRILSWALIAASTGLVLLASPGGASAEHNEKVLYTFLGGGDGQYPDGKLIWDGAGNIYGATYTNVYKITPHGRKTVVHVFSDGPGVSGVVRDDAGNLYGVTTNGGDDNDGTVFEIAADGKVTTLYSFKGGSDGAYPYSELIRDGQGNLYGTTNRGGTGDNGTIFKIAPDGTETVLHRFNGSVDGGNPVAGLVMDGAGNFYGAAQAGPFGNGNVFRMSPNGDLTVLYNFHGYDGSDPWGTLIMDPEGNLYGTTLGGGAYRRGTVFELSPKGEMTSLHSFGRGTDGRGLQGGLVRGADGSLYGGTYDGGTFNKGTVFKIKPNGKETVLYSFTGGSDGWSLSGTPLLDSNGIVYGASDLGGFCSTSTNGCGVFFKLKH